MLSPVLTRPGLATAVTGVVLAVGGAVLGYREVLALGAVLLAAVLIAVAAVLGRLDAVVRRAVSPARVTRGDVALGEITLSSASGRGMRPTTAVDLVAGTPVPVPLPRLAQGTQVRRSYRLPTDRRGEVQLGPLRIQRRDGLGLASRDRAVGEVATLLVRPRVLTLGGLPGGRTRSLDGPTSDSAPQGTVTYHALRDYVPGDDRRHIHWKASARTGTLIVRQYVDTSQPDTWVLLATDAGAEEQDFEEAVELAASVCGAAHAVGFPVSLVLSGSGPRGAAEQVAGDLGALLDRLAVVQPDAPDRPGRAAPAGGLLAALSEHAQRGRGDSAVVIAGATAEAAAGVWARRYGAPGALLRGATAAA